jgi:hypothetical protein
MVTAETSGRLYVNLARQLGDGPGEMTILEDMARVTEMPAEGGHGS